MSGRKKLVSKRAGMKDGQMERSEICCSGNVAVRGTWIQRLIASPKLILLIILVALTSISPSATAAQADSPAAKCPPPARKDDTVETLHGVEVADPYRWLENQDNPETRSWIDAEDRCTATVLDSVPGRSQIEKRLSELMKVDSFGLPVERNGYFFFSKRRADQDLSVLYERHGLQGSDEVLVDPHPLSADHSTSVVLLDVSYDASVVAYGVRAGGQDEVVVHFLDTKTHKELPEQLPRALYEGVALQRDNRGLYYSILRPDGPRAYHHVTGTSVSEDMEIFGKGYGPDRGIGVTISEDGRYLLIALVYGAGSTQADLYFQDLQSGGPLTTVVNDVPSLFYGDIEGGALFIFTNWKAPHWHVYRVDLKNPARDAWKEVIPESDAAIENVSMVGGKILVQYVRNATSELKIFESDGKPGGAVTLPALGAVAGTSGDWEQENVFVNFESFNIPPSIYRYDLKSSKMNSWASPKVSFDSSAYTVEQVWYESKDKTRVPMFLFYKKGLVRDGARPVLLTGYGGFNLNLTPSFSPLAAAWVDAGGIFAQPNLRGGGEFGEAWHQAGMMEKKQTVFDDFESAAEWLIAKGYTDPKHLAIEGGSNGGLLVGAALTQRPELYQAVVCSYPLLDMVRYHKFEEGPTWISEYGSSDNPAQFKYLYAYSPYHNVKNGVKYPAVLFVTGDGDTRVAPLHARKMAALLQAATASDRPILLLYDTKSGHSGGRPLSKEIEERTNILSFLFLELGVKQN
jgi:prolyl oligopeptidase